MIKGKVAHKHAMKAYMESGGIIPLILNLGTKRKSGQLSHPSGFTPGEKVPGTH
jgi:hypothetical protein